MTTLNREHEPEIEKGYEDIYSNTPYLHEDWPSDNAECWYIDLVYVPPHLRGHNVGKTLVSSFIRSLPSHVKRIRLKSCELGSGHTKPFWESLGFQSAYAGDIDGPDGDLSDILVLGVNGNKTPMADFLITNNNEREMHESKEDFKFIDSLL